MDLRWLILAILASFKARSNIFKFSEVLELFYDSRIHYYSYLARGGFNSIFLDYVSWHLKDGALGINNHFKKKLWTYLEKKTPPYVFKISSMNTFSYFKKYHNYVNFQLTDMKFGMRIHIYYTKAASTVKQN